MKKNLQLSGYILTIVASGVLFATLLSTEILLLINGHNFDFLNVISMIIYIFLAITCGLSVGGLSNLKISKKYLFRFKFDYLSTISKKTAVIIVILNFVSIALLITYLVYFALIWTLVICLLAILSIIAANVVLIVAISMKGPFLERQIAQSPDENQNFSNFAPQVSDSDAINNVENETEIEDETQKLKRKIEKLNEMKENQLIDDQEYSKIKMQYVQQYLDRK